MLFSAQPATNAASPLILTRLMHLPLLTNYNGKDHVLSDVIPYLS